MQKKYVDFSFLVIEIPPVSIIEVFPDVVYLGNVRLSASVKLLKCFVTMNHHTVCSLP